MSSSLPPASGRSGKETLHVPAVNGEPILPPGKDPSRETRGEVNRLVVEHIKERKIFFSTTPPKESFFARHASKQIHFAPFTAYSANGNGEAPTFAAHALSDAQRRLLRNPWDTFSLVSLSETATLSVEAQTQLGAQGLVLIAAPQDDETVALDFGTAANTQPRPGVRLKKQGNGYVCAGEGGIQAVTSDPIFVGTTLRDAIETKKMTTEAQGKIVSEEVLFKESEIRCGVTLIPIHGNNYFLIDGIKDTTISVPQSLVERTKAQQLELVNTEKQTPNGAFVSVANPEHNFRNEDAVAITTNGTGIVADGMGGYENGFYMSRLITSAIARIDNALGQSQDQRQMANAIVHELVATHEMLKNIPSKGDATVAVARVVKDKHGKRYGVWGNVGDTRVYMYNPSAPDGKRKLVLLSTDDNLLRRWERRAKEGNGWLTLSPEDPPISQFENFGFLTDKKSRVLLDEAKMDTLRELGDVTPDFATFSEDTLQLSVYDTRNIADGLRNGPGKQQPAEYHSGFYELPSGAELVLMSDGTSDTLHEAALVSALSEGKTPLQQAKAVASRVQGLFAKHAQALSGVREGDPDPMALQRVKEDDVSVIILT